MTHVDVSVPNGCGILGDVKQRYFSMYLQVVQYIFSVTLDHENNSSNKNQCITTQI